MSSRFKLYKDTNKVKAQRKKDNTRYWNKCKSGVNTNKKWSAEENEYLLNSSENYEIIARKLCRGINAITVQKSKLLKESKMNLELGNLFFNSNKNQRYECPNFIIALLRDIERELKLTMFAINHEEYESPFDNTGNSFKELSNVFEVQAYNWNNEESTDYNFMFNCGNEKYIKISWYKYLGRDTTINVNLISNENKISEYLTNLILDCYNKSINALKQYRMENEIDSGLQAKPIKTNEEAEWEIGNSNDDDIIYLNLKGKLDMRFSRFHLNINDAQRLSNDIGIICMNSYFNEPKMRITRVIKEEDTDNE